MATAAPSTNYMIQITLDRLKEVKEFRDALKDIVSYSGKDVNLSVTLDQTAMDGLATQVGKAVSKGTKNAKVGTGGGVQNAATSSSFSMPPEMTRALADIAAMGPSLDKFVKAVDKFATISKPKGDGNSVDLKSDLKGLDKNLAALRASVDALTSRIASGVPADQRRAPASAAVSPLATTTGATNDQEAKRAMVRLERQIEVLSRVIDMKSIEARGPKGTDSKIRAFAGAMHIADPTKNIANIVSALREALVPGRQSPGGTKGVYESGGRGVAGEAAANVAESLGDIDDVLDKARAKLEHKLNELLALRSQSPQQIMRAFGITPRTSASSGISEFYSEPARGQRQPDFKFPMKSVEDAFARIADNFAKTITAALAKAPDAIVDAAAVATAAKTSLSPAASVLISEASGGNNAQEQIMRDMLARRKVDRLNDERIVAEHRASERAKKSGIARRSKYDALPESQREIMEQYAGQGLIAIPQQNSIGVANQQFLMKDLRNRTSAIFNKSGIAPATGDMRTFMSRPGKTQFSVQDIDELLSQLQGATTSGINVSPKAMGMLKKLKNAINDRDSLARAGMPVEEMEKAEERIKRLAGSFMKRVGLDEVAIGPDAVGGALPTSARPWMAASSGREQRVVSGLRAQLIRENAGRTAEEMKNVPEGYVVMTEGQARSFQKQLGSGRKVVREMRESAKTGVSVPGLDEKYQKLRTDFPLLAEFLSEKPSKQSLATMEKDLDHAYKQVGTVREHYRAAGGGGVKTRIPRMNIDGERVVVTPAMLARESDPALKGRMEKTVARARQGGLEFKWYDDERMAAIQAQMAEYERVLPKASSKERTRITGSLNMLQGAWDRGGEWKSKKNIDSPFTLDERVKGMLDLVRAGGGGDKDGPPPPTSPDGKNAPWDPEEFKRLQGIANELNNLSIQKLLAQFKALAAYARTINHHMGGVRATLASDGVGPHVARASQLATWKENRIDSYAAKKDFDDYSRDNRIKLEEERRATKQMEEDAKTQRQQMAIAARQAARSSRSSRHRQGIDEDTSTTGRLTQIGQTAASWVTALMGRGQGEKFLEKQALKDLGRTFGSVDSGQRQITTLTHQIEAARILGLDDTAPTRGRARAAGSLSAQYRSMVDATARAGHIMPEQFGPLMPDVEAAMQLRGRMDPAAQQLEALRENLKRARGAKRGTSEYDEARAGARENRQKLSDMGLHSVGAAKSSIRVWAEDERLLSQSIGARAQAVHAGILANDKHIGQMDRLISKMKSLATYAGAGMVVYGVVGQIRRAWSEAMQLEQSAAFIQGVLPHGTKSDRSQITNESIKIAREYGVQMSQVTSVLKLFVQTGVGVDKALAQTRTAMMAVKAVGLEAQQAVEMLVAVENITAGRVGPQDILNRISRVESTRAISAQDISAAIQLAAPLAMQVQPGLLGTIDPLDVVSGMATSIVEKTRVTGNQAATSMRMMMARVSQPRVQRQLQEEFGVNLGGRSKDELRPMSDIFHDISATYQKLMKEGDSVKAARLLVVAAGARQINPAAAMFSDWANVMDVAKTSSESFADAQRRLAIQTETLAYKTQQLSAAWSGFLAKFVDATGLMAVAKGASVVGRKMLGVGVEGEGMPMGGALVSGGMAATLFGLSSGAGALGKSKLLEGSMGGLARGLTAISSSAFLSGAGAFLAIIAGIAALYGIRKLMTKGGPAEYRDIDTKKLAENEVIQQFNERAGRLGETRNVRAEVQNIALGIRESMMKDPKYGAEVFTGEKTQAGAYEHFVDRFVEAMSAKFPALAAISDPTERTTEALQLLRGTTMQSTVVVDMRASEIMSKVDEFAQNVQSNWKAGSIVANGQMWRYMGGLGDTLRGTRMAVDVGLPGILGGDRRTARLPGLGGFAGAALPMQGGRTLAGLVAENKTGSMTEIQALDVVAKKYLTLNGEQKKLIQLATSASGEINRSVLMTSREGQDALARVDARKSLRDSLGAHLEQKLNLGGALSGAMGLQASFNGEINRETPGAAFQTVLMELFAEMRADIQRKIQRTTSRPEIEALQQSERMMGRVANRISQPAALKAIDGGLGRMRLRERAAEVMMEMGAQMDEIRTYAPLAQHAGVDYNAPQERANVLTGGMRRVAGLRGQVRNDMLRAMLNQSHGQAQVARELMDEFTSAEDGSGTGLPPGSERLAANLPGASARIQAVAGTMGEKERRRLAAQVTHASRELDQLRMGDAIFEGLPPRVLNDLQGYADEINADLPKDQAQAGEALLRKMLLINMSYDMLGKWVSEQARLAHEQAAIMRRITTQYQDQADWQATRAKLRTDRADVMFEVAERRATYDEQRGAVVAGSGLTVQHQRLIARANAELERSDLDRNKQLGDLYGRSYTADGKLTVSEADFNISRNTIISGADRRRLEIEGGAQNDIIRMRENATLEYQLSKFNDIVTALNSFTEPFANVLKETMMSPRGFKGHNAAQQIFGSVSEMVSSRVSKRLTDSLFSAETGVFGNAIQKMLGDSPVVIQQDTIRKGTSAGVVEGLSYFYAGTGSAALTYGQLRGGATGAAVAVGAGAAAAGANILGGIDPATGQPIPTVIGATQIDTGAITANATNLKIPGKSWKNVGNMALLMGAQVGGGLLGDAVGGNKGRSYASEGASMGMMVGSLIPGLGTVMGPVVGSLLGGLLGGLFGKKKDKVTPEYAALERIERNTRESVMAIENQTRKLLEFDSRMLNVPASFSVPTYRPMELGAAPAAQTGAYTDNRTININLPNATGSPQDIARAVKQAVQTEMRDTGSFTSNKYGR